MKNKFKIINHNKFNLIRNNQIIKQAYSTCLTANTKWNSLKKTWTKSIGKLCNVLVLRIVIATPIRGGIMVLVRGGWEVWQFIFLVLLSLGLVLVFSCTVFHPEHLRKWLRKGSDYTFSHFKRPFYWAKNKKKCKINSRNFTYDGLTFSSSFLVSGEVRKGVKK